MERITQLEKAEMSLRIERQQIDAQLKEARRGRIEEAAFLEVEKTEARLKLEMQLLELGLQKTRREVIEAMKDEIVGLQTKLLNQTVARTRLAQELEEIRSANAAAAKMRNTEREAKAKEELKKVVMGRAVRMAMKCRMRKQMQDETAALLVDAEKTIVTLQERLGAEQLRRAEAEKARDDVLATAREMKMKFGAVVDKHRREDVDVKRRTSDAAATGMSLIPQPSKLVAPCDRENKENNENRPSFIKRWYGCPLNPSFS